MQSFKLNLRSTSNYFSLLIRERIIFIFSMQNFKLNLSSTPNYFSLIRERIRFSGQKLNLHIFLNWCEKFQDDTFPKTQGVHFKKKQKLILIQLSFLILRISWFSLFSNHLTVLENIFY